MKTRNFLYLMLLVALVASVFSPSAVRFAFSVQPSQTSQKLSLTDFISSISTQGYNVKIANNSFEFLSFSQEKAVLVIIGPDIPLTDQELSTVLSSYQQGKLSLLLAEGNTTLNPLLTRLGAYIDGNVIYERSDVFNIQFYLGNKPVSGVIDVASPIHLTGTTLTPVAFSSPTSTEWRDYKPVNLTHYSRAVVATMNTQSGSKLILISSISPFTNFLYQNDSEMAESFLSWLTDGNKNVEIIVDQSHYNTNVLPNIPNISFGIPFGWIASLALSSFLYGISGVYYYTGYSGVSSIISRFNLNFFGLNIGLILSIAFAVMLLLFVRRTLRSWFAREQAVKDDQPLPDIERDFLLESRERIDFLALSRKKSFQIATLSQLYDILQDVTRSEIGKDFAELTREDIINIAGQEKVAQFLKFVREMKRIQEYALGRRRFLFPPVIFWGRKVSALTKTANDFLGVLGSKLL